MLIARQKKQENIAEYVVYMFQIEDLMRACNLDFEIVKQKIISQYSQTKKLLDEISYWYENIIELMKNQKIEKKGHLQEIENVIDDLNDLHLQLLRSPLHPDHSSGRTGLPHGSGIRGCVYVFCRSQKEAV